MQEVVRDVKRGWLWPPALALLLVAALSVLQFQWLDALDEHERERTRTRLRSDALRFCEEINRELARAAVAFQLDADEIWRGDATNAAARYEYWLAHAPHPRMIRDIWLAIPDRRDAPASMRWRALYLDYVQNRFVDRPTPPNIERLRDRPAVSPLHTAVFDVDAFVLVVPIFPHASVTKINTGLVLLRLDRDYWARELLPQLARRNFSLPASSSEWEHRISIVSSRMPHVYDSHPQDSKSEPADLQTAAPLFQLRPVSADLRAWRVAALSASHWSDGLAPEDTAQAPASWQLRISRRPHSLASFAQRLARTNLIIGSLLLILLVASIVLWLIAWRRAHLLTIRQMEFVAGISHELRTPVSAVQALAANLTDGVVRDLEQARRYGKLVQQEARRLAEMTEQVLGFASAENADRLAMRKHPVEALIRSAAQAMQLQIDEQGFVCEITLAPDIPDIPVDPAAIERALRNLIGNALKFSAGQHKIAISAGVHSRGSHNEIWIAVRDHGIGIDARDLPRIFQPFYRSRAALDGSIPGTGLGLSLVRRIAQMHGGRVEVHSEPGAGSTFTLYLLAA